MSFHPPNISTRSRIGASDPSGRKGHIAVKSCGKLLDSSVALKRTGGVGPAPRCNVTPDASSSLLDSDASLAVVDWPRERETELCEVSSFDRIRASIDGIGLGAVLLR